MVGVELRQLRYVVAVAEELHFGRAARREYITPSALSQQIVRAEREVGTALFVRTPRRVTVTSAGAAFVEHARRALAAVEEAAAAARAALAAALVVGFSSHGGGPLMANVLREYAAEHPAVDMRLRELDFAAHFTALDERVVDVLFARGPCTRPPGVRYALLHSEPRVVALPAGHHLAGSGGRDEGVGAPALARERFFRLPPHVPPAWVEHFAPWGVDPAAPRISTANEALSLVAAGAGIALVPESLARSLPRDGVVYRPASVEPSVLGVAWWPGAAADAFAALAVRAAARPPST